MVLIIDDEPDIRFGMRDYLESQGFSVEEADSCAAALASLKRARPDVVVADYLLPDGNALEFLPRMAEVQADVPVIVLTAHGSIDLAVRAVKLGAEQFLTKPVEMPALLVILQRVVENQRNRRRQQARESKKGRDHPDPFIGTSSAVKLLAADARKVLNAESPVLILGETGAGKGVLARWLHANSGRAEEAFVDINCAGLAAELLDSELFGYEKGAFTSAVNAKAGLLEVSHRGTLFLDEIGDMAPQVQAKVLKVLEEQRFRRLGDVRDRRVDVRLIAATHQDVATAVRERRFRQDLYFRINTFPINVPPLRERKEDIPILARVLLRGLCADLGRDEVELTTEAERTLAAYGWPGNVRELRNVLERALLLSEGDNLARHDLRFEAGAAVTADEGASAELTLRDVERQHIERVLKAEGGKVEASARRLGIPRSSLYQKLKEYRIDRSRFQTPNPAVGDH